jgi:hypothetical protein
MFVKPKHEIVRDPYTREPLPQAGAHVPETRHWMRRLAHGVIEIVVEPKPEPAPEAAEPAAEPKAEPGEHQEHVA